MARQSQPSPEPEILLPQNAVVPSGTGLPDFDRLSPQEREILMKVFYAGVGAAAAMQTEVPAEVNVKEYYGTAPNDFRREFSTLSRPMQGGDIGRYVKHHGRG
jgi:hypothetical protein